MAAVAYVGAVAIADLERGVSEAVDGRSGIAAGRSAVVRSRRHGKVCFGSRNRSCAQAVVVTTRRRTGLVGSLRHEWVMLGLRWRGALNRLNCRCVRWLLSLDRRVVSWLCQRQLAYQERLRRQWQALHDEGPHSFAPIPPRYEALDVFPPCTN